MDNPAPYDVSSVLVDQTFTAEYPKNAKIHPLDSVKSLNGFCSRLQFAAFAKWAREQGGELKVLADQGYSENLDTLTKELTDKKAEDPIVAAVRKRIFELLPKAVEVFIVSDEKSTSAPALAKTQRKRRRQVTRKEMMTTAEECALCTPEVATPKFDLQAFQVG